MCQESFCLGMLACAVTKETGTAAGHQRHFQTSREGAGQPCTSPSLVLPAVLGWRCTPTVGSTARCPPLCEVTLCHGSNPAAWGGPSCSAQDAPGTRGFCTEFWLLETPRANSTKHQQWEAFSIHQDLDSASYLSSAWLWVVPPVPPAARGGARSLQMQGESVVPSGCSAGCPLPTLGAGPVHRRASLEKGMDQLSLPSPGWSPSGSLCLTPCGSTTTAPTLLRMRALVLRSPPPPCFVPQAC